MSHWGDSFDDWNKSFSSASSACDISSSDIFQSDHPHRPGGQSARDPFNTVLTSSAAYPVNHVSSIPSIDSTGNEWISYFGSTASASGVTPSLSAPEEAGNHASSASPSVIDSILKHFVQYTPPTPPAASPIWQTTTSSRYTSYETTGSDETDSCSSESGPEPADGTPATSDTSLEAGLLFAIDQDQDEEVAIPDDLVLAGLELRGEYRVEPPFFDANNINQGDVSNNIHRFLENEHEQHQAEPTAIPWVAGAQDIRRHTSSSILAPSPGPAYIEYYSLTGAHTQVHGKAQERKTILANLKAQYTLWGPSRDGTSAGTPGPPQDISAYALAQYSTVETESRGRRARDQRDGTMEWLRETSHHSQICGAVDCVTFSPETLSSIFYRSFASSHLSYDSLSTFTEELIAPDGLAYNSEYDIDFSLGFGGVFRYKVCTFTPRNKNALQSYRKRQGEDELCVQESLPIALNLFCLQSHAEELDVRLDQIIDSESGLEEYVDLMQRRKDEGLNVEILRCIVEWYLTFKNKFSETEDCICRVALKALMTTTLLRLVPRVKDMPESLSRYLSPQPRALDSAHLSPVAPKLLTRQIKASIHHLQNELLQALFYYFTCALELATEVKVAIALLVATVLELARNAGRDFAKFASTINSTVVVKPQDITQYEMNIQTQVFGRVRASILDSAGEMGQLGEMLRNIDLTVKGKGKESQETQFVSVILGAVL
ncbi:hypothetical protein BDZ45DRAFT_724367 [Acephala macrosclerotiorum]|nr:hypothetical protein BDZ45DRAFT_724367 [Acephala macrosclerotiorum]